MDETTSQIPRVACQERKELTSLSFPKLQLSRKFSRAC